MAAALQRTADKGIKGFYEGKTARLQLAAYPELKPVTLEASRANAMEATKAILQARG